MEQTSKINQNRTRRARMLLRKVDIALKDEGIDAALKELMRVRLIIPLTPTIHRWLRDYRDMLDAWQTGLMPQVVKEFKTFGFRRARDMACRSCGLITKERKRAFYLICQDVLEQMSLRFQNSLSDVEETSCLSEPQVVSLETVDQDELEHGTHY